MVAHLMELANTMFRYRGTEVAAGPAWSEAIRLLLLMLAPAAPHITEELWSRVEVGSGEWSSIHTQSWPAVDPSAIVDETREVPIQINGKVRDKVTVPIGIEPSELERVVLARDRVRELLAGRKPDRVINAGGRLVNIVVRD
jgi:leucyl-tRNA synthetase